MSLASEVSAITLTAFSSVLACNFVSYSYNGFLLAILILLLLSGSSLVSTVFLLVFASLISLAKLSRIASTAGSEMPKHQKTNGNLRPLQSPLTPARARPHTWLPDLPSPSFPGPSHSYTSLSPHCVCSLSFCPLISPLGADTWSSLLKVSSFLRFFCLPSTPSLCLLSMAL